MRTLFLNRILMGIILILVAYIYFFCYYTSKDTICTNYSGSINELDVKLVHEMTNGYKNYQHRIISDSLGFEDTRVLTFKLPTLKRFLHHLEKITKSKRGTITDDDLALNVYYARYPEKTTWGTGEIFNKDLSIFLNDSITEQYEYHHTLVFIPSIKDKKGNYMDFNPNDIQTYDFGMRENDRYSPRSNISTAAFGISTGSKSATSSNNTSAQNHGGAFPPDTKTSGFVFY